MSGEYGGRQQNVAIGSYVCIDGLDSRRFESGFTFQCWLQPRISQHTSVQGIASSWDPAANRGFSLFLSTEGILTFEAAGVNGTVWVQDTEPVVAGRWYFIAVRFDAIAQQLKLDILECKRRWLSSVRRRITEVRQCEIVPNEGIFVLGARSLISRPRGVAIPKGCLNGKVDRPRLWSRCLTDEEVEHLGRDGDPLELLDGLVGCWDLSQGVGTRSVVDISGNGFHGQACNMPMRAVVGANWNGSCISYAADPSQYGAIWFHEDDLDDCAWETDFVVTTSEDWQSGVYAVRLTAGDSIDYVPFYLRPAASQAKNRVLFLAPTNTYLAYGNEKQFQVIWTDPEFIEKSTDVEVEVKPLDRFLLSHPELGASIYDLHPDGSGICHSSRLRPVLTMRPQFLHWLHNQARHFAADLYLLEWLEQQQIAYDVATDEDLHLHGESLLADYPVVITGSHPEYWTFSMLHGLESYLESGGKLVYLGGNGFYWVTAMDDTAPHFIEVRRGVSGIRAWTSHPGEVMLATTGEPGGLWRHRGLPPNSLCGVGFASEGWGGAPGYVRTQGSLDPSASFIFEGVSDDEIIGDFGFIMNGAAGDEIDRLDYSLGTPDETLRLATTELRHSDYYQLVVEDCSFVLPGLGGTEEPRVRSDLTYLEDRNGGAVFSTGSINWIGSLPWNDGQNNVSTITRNVIRRFADLS
ncbi:MAG: LamG domain-containing protein [Thermomicrobiales bacterium]|nr:LamG domain-containing protein [Thermomicrobiales bacterium]